MPLFKFIFFSLSLFSLSFIGCNTPSKVQKENEASYLNYVEDIKEIKATCTSYSDYVSKMNIVQDKYNFNYAESGEVISSSDILSSESSESPGKVNNEALGKVKADIFDNNFLATKWGEYDIENTFFNTYSVQNNSSINVTLEQYANTYVDPFLILYTVDNGDPSSDPSLQQGLTIRAFNDDYSGLYPYASWENNTGSTQEVTALIFAYSSYNSGLARMIIDAGANHYEGTILVKGKALFGDMGYLNGAGNTIDLPNEWVMSDNIAIAASSYFEDIYSKFYSWGDYAPEVTDGANTYIWAFNMSSMRGIANDFLAEEGNSSGSATARYVNEDVSLNPEFTFPSGSWHYPNVILLAGNSNGGKAKILQVREFTRD